MTTFKKAKVDDAPKAYKTIYRLAWDPKTREHKEYSCKGEYWEPTYWWSFIVACTKEDFKHYKQLYPWYEANKDNHEKEDLETPQGDVLTHADRARKWLHSKRCTFGHSLGQLLESPTFMRESDLHFTHKEQDFLESCYTYFKDEQEKVYGHRKN